MRSVVLIDFVPPLLAPEGEYLALSGDISGCQKHVGGVGGDTGI